MARVHSTGGSRLSLSLLSPFLLLLMLLLLMMLMLLLLMMLLLLILLLLLLLRLIRPSAASVDVDIGSGICRLDSPYVCSFTPRTLSASIVGALIVFEQIAQCSHSI